MTPFTSDVHNNIYAYIKKARSIEAHQYMLKNKNNTLCYRIKKERRKVKRTKKGERQKKECYIKNRCRSQQNILSLWKWGKRQKCQKLHIIFLKTFYTNLHKEL